MMTTPLPEFVPLRLETGVLADLSHGPHPAIVHGFHDDTLALSEDATHYGMLTEGGAILHDREDRFRLRVGMFFVAVGRCQIAAPGGRGLVISVPGYKGLRQVGGPLEERGRLEYIDGCTDTLLVCPPRRGEPCLNHLHIPPNTAQSAHTHPSERIGVILRGRGECRTGDGSIHALEPGMGWRIPTGALHSFFTTDESLDVIAWHPDSDFGPTDGDHPMRNRTILTSI
ncbi:MAG: cupin domain-containing protein [Armatimonadota bacterium]